MALGPMLTTSTKMSNGKIGNENRTSERTLYTNNKSNIGDKLAESNSEDKLNSNNTSNKVQYL